MPRHSQRAAQVRLPLDGFRCIYMMEPTTQLGPDGATLHLTQYYNNTCSVFAVVPKPDCCDAYTTRALATFDGNSKDWQSLLNRSVRLYNNSIYIQPPVNTTVANMSVITLNGEGDGPFLSPDGVVMPMGQFQEVATIKVQPLSMGCRDPQR